MITVCFFSLQRNFGKTDVKDETSNRKLSFWKRCKRFHIYIADSWQSHCSFIVMLIRICLKNRLLKLKLSVGCSPYSFLISIRPNTMQQHMNIQKSVFLAGFGHSLYTPSYKTIYSGLTLNCLLFLRMHHVLNWRYLSTPRVYIYSKIVALSDLATCKEQCQRNNSLQYGMLWI